MSGAMIFRSAHMVASALVFRRRSKLLQPGNDHTFAALGGRWRIYKSPEIVPADFYLQKVDQF